MQRRYVYTIKHIMDFLKRSDNAKVFSIITGLGMPNHFFKTYTFECSNRLDAAVF